MDPITLLFGENAGSGNSDQIPLDSSSLPHPPPTPLSMSEQLLQILENEDDDLRKIVDQRASDNLIPKHDNLQVLPSYPAAESSSTLMELEGAAEGDPGGGGEKMINQTLMKENIMQQEMDENDVRRRPNSKIMHREIERKRRNDMSSLQRSLRFHLPPEYIRGKRSISEQLNEAVRYIRHLQARTQALRQKRDELRSVSQPNTNGASASSCLLSTDTGNNPHNNHQQEIRNIGDDLCYALGSNTEELGRATVSITCCTSGGGTILEVTVRSCISGESWALSKVIQGLEREGIDVLSSTSSKVDDKWLHFLLAEVEALNMDALDLQLKLTAEVSSP